MLRQLTGRQVSELIAYNSLEPVGFWNAWNQTGMVCSVLANVFGKKDGREFQPQDFMPKPPAHAEEVRTQSLDQMKAALLNIAAWAKRTGKMKGQKGMKPEPIVRKRRGDG